MTRKDKLLEIAKSASDAEFHATTWIDIDGINACLYQQDGYNVAELFSEERLWYDGEIVYKELIERN